MGAGMMLVNADILIIGQQPWDTELGSNCKNIALELSKNNRVLYVNSPLDRITWLRGMRNPKVKKRLNVIKGKRPGLVELQHNLWNYYPDCWAESINWINNDVIFDAFNRVNNRRFSESINKALISLNFRDFILFNDQEIIKGFYLKEYLKPKLSVYYCRDFIIGVDYWKKHGVKLEADLIRKNDVCVSNSEYLNQYCKSFNLNSFNVGQGCDFSGFFADYYNKPGDLFNLEGTIIGYVGTLSSIRLDMEVIKYVANSFPEHHIVLVGPEDDEFKSSELHDLNNVHFLGQKPAHQLPSYIRFFDLCINPQLINDITIGNYPRKVDEYLAFGKPVVASKTKTMEIFSNYAYLASTKEEYVEFIQKALLDDSPDLRTGRIRYALTHTWENSVHEIYKAIDSTLKSLK
jgi:glycosyltransferase involved in cell wall biosynthesis